MKLTDDDFTLFGLPRRFAVSAAELDERWRALQAQVHPDRFAAQGAAAQRVAMQWSVRVNEAHRRLKDPLQRAAYLCALQGGGIEAESNTRMPAEFLMQQMAWREALDEAHSAQALEHLEDEVREESRRMQASLGQSLDERADWQQAAEQVRALMFVQKFLQDVARRAQALEQG